VQGLGSEDPLEPWRSDPPLHLIIALRLEKADPTEEAFHVETFRTKCSEVRAQKIRRWPGSNQGPCAGAWVAQKTQKTPRLTCLKTEI